MGKLIFMSLNSAKQNTRSTWDTILIPDTFIALVNELVYNEINQFIFAGRSGRSIGYIDITVT